MTSNVSILTEAYMLAGDIIADILEALEVELTPLMYAEINESEARDVDLTPESVQEMAIESGHQSDEAEPCAACRLIAARYGLE